MELELQQLRAFVTVAEELHFGRAALRLGLSQPQVSRHVRRLEDSLGVLLFVRDARHTKLTDAGSALLPDAREALAATRRLRDRAAAAVRGAGGRVAVGFLWSTLGPYLPPLVSEAALRHPEIELTVAQLRYVDVVPALRRGEVDLTITRWLQDLGEMIPEVLRREPSLLAIPEAHPLAAEPEVPIIRLHEQPLISLSRETVGAAFDVVLEQLHEQGIRPRIAHSAISPTEALALVSAGVGLYQLPASAAIPRPGIVYRPLVNVRSRIVLTRRPEPPPPPVTAIAELARTLFYEADDASDA